MTDRDTQRFRVTDVWEAREQLQAPAEAQDRSLRAGVGMTSPPTIEFFELNNHPRPG